MLSRFETIYVLNNGLITHQGEYPELLSEGLVVEETMADLESPAPAPDSDKGAELSRNPGDEVDEEEKNKQAPSDWSVYVYFFRSCGLAGVSLFFVLAAALAAERSFESKSAVPLLRLQPNLPLTVRARRLAQNVGGIDDARVDVLHRHIYRSHYRWARLALRSLPVCRP